MNLSCLNKSGLTNNLFLFVILTFNAGKHQMSQFGLCECAVKWGEQQVHGAESSLNHSSACWHDTHQLDELKH